MTKTKAVIFDMDGVIIDPEKLWKRAENEIFSSLGVKVTEEFSKVTKSMTTSQVTKFWYDKFPWQDKEPQIVEQMVISRVIDLIQIEECYINGVKRLIERFKIRSYKI